MSRALETLAQDIREDEMEAIPASWAVEAGNEEIVARETAQQRARFRISRDRLRNIRIELPQNRRAQQKLSSFEGLILDRFIPEIVRNLRHILGKRIEEAAHALR